MVVHIMLVFEELKSILANSVTTDRKKGDVKGDGNLSSSSLNFLGSLYILVK